MILSATSRGAASVGGGADLAGQYYERRGSIATQKIARAIASKSWKWTLLNLAWTVGPVTFVALQIGSYVGLGKAAASNTFIYFAVYTAVAGALAAAASVLHDAFYKPKIADEQARLLRIIDQVHMLMLATRNAVLEELEPPDRRIMAAHYILSGAGITPSAVGNAVQDLTANANLARHARRIDVFVEQGMMSRVRDEWASIAEALEQVRLQLEPVAPQAFALLKARLEGDAPAAKDGLERSEGFIARTLAAADSEDESLMTLHDAYEMLCLLFELLCGRRIAMLGTQIRGNASLKRAKEHFDEALQAYRIAMRRRNSRIRLLAERLYSESDAEAIAEAADSISRLIAMMQRGFSSLPVSQRQRYKSDYEDILRRHRRACQRFRELQKSAQHYQRVWQRQPDGLPIRLQRRYSRRRGFLIIEDEIALLDKQKLRLARDIDELLSEVEIRSGRHLSVYDASHANRAMRFAPADYKQLAMGAAGLLDSLIDLSHSEEQQAIESSNMANFGAIEADFTPPTKAGWANLLVDALHANRRKASHRLARDLVRFYHLNLSQEVIAYFERHFGADRHYLEQLALEQMNQETVQSLLPAAPHDLPDWQKIRSLV